ncbi:MAG: hypothetical protein SFY32_03080 [Bacteroidota bacterium]|nr:hypothetical protein [Bacteroidota bacterium]
MKRSQCLSLNVYFFITFLSVITLLNITSNAQQTLIVNGAFQGKNLYVQNPFTTNMKDFCSDEVYVNDVKVMSNIKSSAYEIDLSHLAQNEPVTIKITHKADCKPKILNAQVIRLSSTFQFASFTVDENLINWSTKGEKIGDKMFVEQFMYNNWITVKEISAKGSTSNNNYTTDQNHHSGINKYRIKFVEKDGNVFYSKVVEFQSTLPEVTFYPKRVSNKIYLSRLADYEVIDGYGNVIVKGKGKEVVCEQLKEGVYYLNVDNKTEKFLKK